MIVPFGTYSMIFQAESIRDIFLQKLTFLEEALANRQLINDRLEVEKKNGFYWTISYDFLCFPQKRISSKEVFEIYLTL
jgi:hypothetical protein